MREEGGDLLIRDENKAVEGRSFVRRYSPRCLAGMAPTLLVLFLYGWSAYAHSLGLLAPWLRQECLAGDAGAASSLSGGTGDDSSARSVLWGAAGCAGPVIATAVYGSLWLLGMTSFLRCAITNTHASAARVEEGERVCAKCGAGKPERCHHCSFCGYCTLKYDHHCPWVGNCVGFWNYKFFVLFLAYTVAMCITILGSSSPFYIDLFANISAFDPSTTHIQLAAQGLVAAVFGISVCVLLASHCRLIAQNLTTMEYTVTAKRGWRNPWDLGFCGNVAAVFGPNPLLWWLPVHTSPGDGMHFGGNNSGNRSMATPSPNQHPESSTPADELTSPLAQGL